MASRPRKIPFNGLYLITRRVTQRELLLKPGKIVNDLLLYCLGNYALKHGIQIHSFIFLSNHFHLVISDPLAKLPAFMRDLCSMSARALNAFYARFENFWAEGSYGEMLLERTAEDILRAIRYVSCNAVEAELVAEAKHWPGLRVLPHEIGKLVFHASRPEWYCNNAAKKSGRRQGRSKLPEQISFTTSLPTANDCSEKDLRLALIHACKDREEGIRDRVAIEGRSFMGVKKVLAQNPRSRPGSSEPRWQRNPRILAADPARRIALIYQLKEFFARYADALERFIAKERDVVFPYGTYKMRVLFNVACEGPPAFA